MNVDLSAIGEAGSSILIVKPSSLGDVVHTLPALAALSRACPGAAIHWLVNREWAPLLADHPSLTSVIEFPRRDFRGYGLRSVSAARRWARENLGSLKPALALDFQGLLRSALLARASNAGHIVGFSRSREGASMFYDERVDVHDWDRRHAVDRYLRLASAVTKAGTSEAVFDLPAGEAPDCSALGSSAAAALDGRFVVLHPFSRGRRKSLSAAEVKRFCECLAPLPVVIVGSDAQHFSPGLPANAIDLLGSTSLAQLIWLLRRASWTVSVDSGPMHLAAALNDRLLAIHTWTNPRVVGPCRAGAWVWRDGFLGRVGELEVDRFPEQRHLARKVWQKADDRDAPLLQTGAIDAIAARVAEQLA